MRSAFQLVYASARIMQLTRVRFDDEHDAYLYYSRVMAWQDIARVRIQDGSTIIHDDTFAERIAALEPAKADKVRDLVRRMDALKCNCERAFAKAATTSTVPSVTRLTVNPASSDVCWCGHTRIEHDGPQSTGHCHAANCVTRCGRFRVKYG